MNIANLVALDDFGGLQTLYLSWVAHLKEEGRAVVTINRASGNPLDIFSRQINEMGILVYSPMRHPVSRLAATTQVTKRMASWFAGWQARRIFSNADVRRLISWNAFPMKQYMPRSGDIVVYDHGLSSIHKPTLAKRNQLRIASEIVAISEANRHLLQDRWGWSRKITVISNPLRTQIALAPLNPRIATRHDGKLIVGSASRLISFKGIATLVHAAAILRGRGVAVELQVAGDGPELDSLKQCALNLGISDHVTFLGIVEDMPAFFSGIDVFVAPSLREPFGLAPLEALASGVPTVLSDVDGHPEVLPFPDAATLLPPRVPLQQYASFGATLSKMPRFVYSPQNQCLMPPLALHPEDIAHAIAAIFDNYPQHGRIAARAGKDIRSRNSMARFADILMATFENLEEGGNNIGSCDAVSKAAA